MVDGRSESDIDAFLRSNTRNGDEVIGDLRAQVGSTRKGVSRLNELFDQYGTPTMLEAFERLIDGAEQRLRKEISKIPDGVVEAEAFLDHDMVNFDRRIAVRAKLTKKGDRITIDFSGSDPHCAGPINIRPQTAETGAMIALVSTLDPGIEVNDGCRRAIEFINPPGRITHVQRPRPLNNYFPALYLCYCVTQMALSKLAPELASAPAGLGTGSIAIGYRGHDGERPIVQYELVVPSLGGTSHGDGAFMVVPTTHVTPS